MKPEHLDIARLVPDPDNARRHTSESIGAIARSLRKFGQQKPIVIAPTGVVMAGSGTLLAAQQLGWTKLWGIRSTLDARMLRAYALADNRTQELSDFDEAALVRQLRELSYVPDGEEAVVYDLGWTETELAALLIEDEPGATPGEPTGAGEKVAAIKVTAAQREVFERALLLLRQDDPQMTEGRAVELLTADWLGAR